MTVGRLPRDARAPPEASAGGSRASFVAPRRRQQQLSSVQHVAFSSYASSRHAKSVAALAQEPPPPPQDPGRRGIWMGLALAAAAMGFVAAEAFADAHSSKDDDVEAKERGNAPQDPKQIGEEINAQRAEAAAAAKTQPLNKRALRKRKTSVREGKCVVSTAAVRGDRTYMEDTSYISSCKRFAAVYDGHGGAAVSQYLRSQLFSLIGPELSRLDREITAERNGVDNSAAKAARRDCVAALLRDAVHKVDEEVLKNGEWKFQGSTAVGVLLFDDVLYSVNVGDSRAVLSRAGDVVELTRDHKPNDAQERARIESLGGKVQWFGYVDAQGEPIEPYGAYRVNGNLAVARAIGDRDARPFVNGEPEVRQFDLEYDKDDFIVIASDGLWDVFTSDEVVTFVQDVMSGELGGREAWSSGGHSDTRVPIFEWSQQYTSDRSMIKAARRRRKVQIANYLVQEALFRGTSDNVSVVVVWLR
ncbi:hypothetical protein BBJ28_00020906 [Nothophytophthora sp. Chile5]|nr:hypothetical protein BBJ28_00020906 [Nothophytophthora sp. Chile5]